MVPLSVFSLFYFILGAAFTHAEAIEVEIDVHAEIELLRKSFGFDNSSSVIKSNGCKLEFVQKLSCDGDEVCLTVSFNEEPKEDTVIIKKVPMIIANSVSASPFEGPSIKRVSYGCTDLYSADLDRNEYISKVLVLEYDNIKVIKVFTEVPAFYLIHEKYFKQINEDQFEDYVKRINVIVNATLDHRKYGISFDLSHMGQTGYVTTQTLHTWMPVSVEI